VDFEWDEAKAVRSVRQHGVDFEEASSTFYDPLALLLSDEYHSATSRGSSYSDDHRKTGCWSRCSLSAATRSGSSLHAMQRRAR
jgi:uncharacterized DUF497 family protein